jgi:uncharacterized protein (DUF1810 family)
MEPNDLERFVQAQAPLIDTVRAELTAGRKRSHWMWFVFPQLRGLGRSDTARHYGLADLEHARAYWRHPLLGPRLAECLGLLLALPAGRSMHDVFGSPDDLKLRSCLTLFEAAAPDEPSFALALERWFGGQRDPLTHALIRPCGRASP